VLHITESAAALINELVESSDLPEGAGLRIAQREDHAALAMHLTAEPGGEDTVVVEDESSVFLGPVAAARVHRQTLDAEVRPDSRSFYLRD
jgi:Fe-S cluster assembly iron-binding protein IscA